MGQSSLPIWIPGTIEFIGAGGIPLPTCHKMISSQNQFFRDPNIFPKRSPGQNVNLGVPKSDPGPTNPPLGMKKQKMRAEIPCRTPPSKNQTEPYGASYGQKQSLSQNLKIWGSFGVAFWRLIGPWRRHFSPNWQPLEDVWGGFVNTY